MYNFIFPKQTAMKNYITLHVLTMLMVCFFCLQTKGQKIDTTTADHLKQVRSLYKSKIDSSKLYITSYLFDTLIRETQNKISGVLIKEGKTIATTAAVDDKSLTVNYTLPVQIGSLFSIQLTAGGTAKDKFVDIFSEGKYQRTITGGLNFNLLLPYNSATYDFSDKWMLWNALKLQDHSYTSRQKEKEDALKVKLTQLDLLCKSCDSFICKPNSIALKGNIFTDDDLKRKSCPIDSLKQYFKLLGELAPYVNKKNDITECDSLYKFLSWVKASKDAIAMDMADRENLKELDSLQRKATWSNFKYTWLSGSLKANQSVQPLFSPNATEKLYTSDYHDFFISASLSFNRMWVGVKKKVTHFISPTLSFDNALNFEKDSLVTIQAQQDVQVGTESVKLVKSTSFYRQLPNYKNNFGIELPYVLYFPKTGFGLDFAVGTKFSEKLENVYARLGFYLPIATDKDNTVTIEPIIRLNKLNKRELHFLKDMLSFGFVLSVSIPKYLK